MTAAIFSETKMAWGSFLECCGTCRPLFLLGEAVVSAAAVVQQHSGVFIPAQRRWLCLLFTEREKQDGGKGAQTLLAMDVFLTLFGKS